jgi:hypothetical protein
LQVVAVVKKVVVVQVDSVQLLQQQVVAVHLKLL